MRRTLEAGLVAEFETPAQIVRAAHEMRGMGYVKLEAFTPYPMLELEHAIGLRRSSLGWLVFACALFGAAAAYLVQWWTSAVDYPLDVGGRPPNSPPAFVPITFEMAILAAGVSSLVALVVISGLPALYQPVFDIPGFHRATIDRFFLAVSATDPAFDRSAVGERLHAVGALRVEPVGLGPRQPGEGQPGEGQPGEGGVA
jgi:hypothetical protein